jgi:hypothetical protein
MAIHTKLGTELNLWLTDSRTEGTKWLDALARPELEAAGKEMVRLGVALKIREMLRQAAGDLSDRISPGLAQFVSAARKRAGPNLNEKESLLLEMLTAEPFFHFIELALQKHTVVKATDATALYFFFALILGSPYWGNVVYSKANGYISLNMHLYPVALGAFVVLFRAVSLATDFQQIADAIGFFFNILQQIVVKVTAAPGFDPLTAATYLVLVDLLPGCMPDIEYGRIAASFPRNLITDAYETLENASESARAGLAASAAQTKSKKGKK